jgi:hypothetical protein
VPALKPAVETEIEIVEDPEPDDAVPDVGDTLNQFPLPDAVLAAAVHDNVPLPLFAIATDCAAGTVPPIVYANCRVVGAAAIVDGFANAAMIAMESAPLVV